MDPITIFLAVLAGFILYQLYAVLGRRDGHEPEEHERPTMGPVANDEPEPAEHYYEPEPENLPQWVQDIRAAYPDFDEKEFLSGAKSAYEMIVEAFAANTLNSVKPFVAPSVYKAFETAASAREAAGQTSELQFVGTERAEVAESKVENGLIRVTVAFISNQIRVLRDDTGEVIDGDPNRIDRVKDRWTFSRSVSSSDPNWQLVATGGLEPAAG